MPTYEYECARCGHRWELFQPITARPIRTCASCGSRSAKRLIGTGAGVIFKGSGFYQTDYRSESYKKAAQADKAEAPSSSGDSKSKSGSTSTDSTKTAQTAKPAVTGGDA